MKWKYLVPCAQTALSAVHIVLSPNKVELACYVRTGCVQRGSHCSVRTDCVQCSSHCSDSEQSGTSLLRSHGLRSARFALFSSHGLRSARFALFRVVTKWNYLVQCVRTAFSAVRIVQCCNEVEVSGSVRTDCTERGSHCSDSEQSGTILFHAHRLR